MANLILRFAVVGADPATGAEKQLATKALAVKADERVGDVQAKLRTKVEDLAAGVGADSDLCIFLPPADGLAGLWLDSQKTFADYMAGGREVPPPEKVVENRKRVLKDKDVLEYRKAKRLLRVQTLDLRVTTLLVDNCKSIGQIIDVICKKLNIPNNDEYSLAFKEAKKAEEKQLTEDELRIKNTMAKIQQSKGLNTEAEIPWLQHDMTLMENGVSEAEVLIMKTKFFTEKMAEEISKENPVQLKMFYEQAKTDILKGTHPVTKDVSKKLAAYQMQAQSGDWVDGKKI